MERNKMLVNTAMWGHAIQRAKSTGLSAPLWGYKGEERRMYEDFYKQFVDTVTYWYTLSQVIHAYIPW